MTVEELTEIFAKRDAEYKAAQEKRDAELAAQNAEYKAAQEKRDAELAAQNAEYNKRFAEQGERIDKLCERSDKIDERVDKLCERIDKLTITVEKTGKLVGNLTNKFGSFFERLMIPGIIDKFNEKGFHFDKVRTNLEYSRNKDKRTITEVDAILENGKDVILIETKAELRSEHIKEHLKSIELLRKNGKFKGKRIYGAISCGYARKPTLDYGLKSGLFMLRQPDSFAVEIADFPKGYSAKAW